MPLERSIILNNPQVQGSRIVFSWRVDPASAMYKDCSFYLDFPVGDDLNEIPLSLLQVLQMFCLYNHWLILRPCHVFLPFEISSEEKAFWYRLMRVSLDTLESSKGSTAENLDIRLVNCGAPKVAKPLCTSSNRGATAFSCGKDSLLQAGLLAEISERPLLVTTTMPVEGLEAHRSKRRERVLRKVAGMRSFEHVEVKSNYREIFDNPHPYTAHQYPIALSELTDTFVYLTSLAVSAYSRGVGHLFIASEAEVQENFERKGRIIQHKHFMYSLVTLKAIEKRLEPFGFKLSSLTSPLYSSLVQELLWSRYPGIRSLQFSCYSMKEGEEICSTCGNCLRNGFCALAMGADPGEMDIDFWKTMEGNCDWKPVTKEASRHQSEPDRRVSASISAQVARHLRNVSSLSLARALLRARKWSLFSWRFWYLLIAFGRMKSRAWQVEVPAALGYRRAYLEFVDPLFREGLSQILSEHFAEEDELEYRQLFSRSQELVAYICDGDCVQAGKSCNTKVFGIGWAKTGTSTLGACLKLLGYEHQSQDLSLVQWIEKGDLSPIIELAKKKDSFDDWPWIILYRELDQAFPGSKFILTTRDSKRWMTSYRNMLRNQGEPDDSLNEVRRILYGLPFPRVEESQLIERYEQHNKEVREYFKDRPEKLLLLDWEKGDGWKELCSFLGKEPPDLDFPHENKGVYEDYSTENQYRRGL